MHCSDLSKQHPALGLTWKLACSAELPLGVLRSARQSFDSEPGFTRSLDSDSHPGRPCACLNLILCVLGVNRRAHVSDVGRELEATLGLAGQFTRP